MSTHRCARGRRCAATESTPDGPVLGALIEAAEGLCRACERRVEVAIRDLPALYVELELLVGYHARRDGGEYVRGTREPPVPVRLDVVSLQQNLDATAAMWAAPLARRCRIPWDATAVRYMRAGPRLAWAARILANSLHALLRLPYAEFHVRTPLGVITTRRRGLDGALELLALSEQGHRLVTGGPGHSRLPAPCPDCEGVLIRYNGSDQVTCQSCGRSWPETDYRRLCLVLAQDYAPPARRRA